MTRDTVPNAQPATMHTPGPWTVARIKTLSGVPMYLIEQERMSEDRQEANARLIAAAPDLLVALRDLLESIERAAANGLDTTGHIGVGDAFRAIRKAEGRA